MPSGIYKHKKSQGYQLGHKVNSGRSSWNKGKTGIKTSNKGQIAWNKGKKLSEEHKKHLSESHKGLQISLKSQFKKGCIPWNKDKKWLDNRGEKHWHWQGGNNKRYLHTTQLFEYKKWRKSVFERDNYTCQNIDCDKSEKYLEAHHIKSWAKFPKLRFNIENGITYCKKCHKIETYKH